jgi:hypothetical protein
MSYTLQGIIGPLDALRAVARDEPLVKLPQAMALLPFSEAVRAAREIPFLPLTDEGQEYLPESIAVWCGHLSADTEIAYVEAELFGGAGTQAGALFDHRNHITTLVAPDAINRVLALLNVAPSGGDRFDALGLGDHRNTEQWLRHERA